MNREEIVWTLDTGFVPKLKKRILRSCAYVEALLDDMLEDGVLDKSLPKEFTVTFLEVKIPFFNVPTEFELRNWNLKGSETLYRVGDCLISELDDRLFVEAIVGVDNLKFDCDSNLKFSSIFSSNSSIEGSVECVIFNFTFSIESRTGLNALVHKFYISDLVGLKVGLKGKGFFKIYLSVVLESVVSVFQDQIKKQLEMDIGRLLGLVLPLYEFPPEGPFSTDISSGEEELE